MNEQNTKQEAAQAESPPAGPAGFKVAGSIKTKIGLAFAAMAVAVALVGGTGIYLSRETGVAMDNMSRNAASLSKEAAITEIHESVRGDVLEMMLLAQADGERAEKMAKWDAIAKKREKERKELFAALDANSRLGQYDDKLAGFSADMHPDFYKLFDSAAKIGSMAKAHVELGSEGADVDRKARLKAIEDEYSGVFAKVFKVLVGKNDRVTGDFEQKNKDIKELAVSQKTRGFEVQGAALVLALLVGSLFVALLFRSLNKKIAQLLSMIQRIKNGEFDVAYAVKGDDEMKLIGESLTEMAGDIEGLQERNAGILREAEHENKELNDSIVELLGTVFAMTKKDLTVRAPVKENVVGTIADSINMVIQSTNEAITGASKIAEMVKGASEESQGKSTEIVALSRRSKEVVDSVISNVEKSLHEIRTVALVARESKAAADMATESTSQALAMVKDTVSSMGSIRETISNTETKIKKLAERSQEIGFIVQLIGDISERTHVLALNATIQAAVAGDAGRGFAAIAEEIQKLAENTKEATNKIARLVENIQVETSDTIQMVNQTIDKVVAGVKHAESSGQQMTETQGKTVELADAVRKISAAISEHETLTGEMKSEAEILGGTQVEFSSAALDQLMRARSLLSFSLRLKETVDQFKTS